MKIRCFSKSAARVFGMSIFACAIAGLMPTSAHACSRTPMTLEQANFRYLVDKASSIILATVTAQNPVNDPEVSQRVALPIYKFSLFVEEQVKGTLEGATFVYGTLPEYAPPRSPLRHWTPGDFWNAFTPKMRENIYCGFVPSFEVGKTYLLFLDGEGRVQTKFGLGYEEITALDDPWLTAVRALANDPERRFARKASALDILRAADQVALVRVGECNTPISDENTIVEVLWGFQGAPIPSAMLQLFEPPHRGCNSNSQWIVAIFNVGRTIPDMAGISFPVTDDVADLSALWPPASDREIGESRMPVWNSQLEREGPEILTLTELREGLRLPQLPE